MLRSRIPVVLLLASLASAPAWSRPVADHRGAPTAVSGAYSITFNLNIESTLPANSTITCKAQIVPAGANLNSFNSQFAAVPLESAGGVASVTGSTATCVVEIPFSWTVDSSRGGVSLSYEIDADNAPGVLPAVVRTSAQQGIAETYPTSGGTSAVSFNVTF
jgi:hypothetical protein